VLDRLMREQLPPPTRLLITSPHGLRGALERAIDTEIEQARLGKPASILLKVNSLEDRPLIRKLYDADRAGVKVRAIIRGICCLRTQVPGHSKHIKAISIVDRYLEHARAFAFHNAGKPTLHLASADWMERNLDYRVETAFPCFGPHAQSRSARLAGAPVERPRKSPCAGPRPDQRLPSTAQREGGAGTARLVCGAAESGEGVT
jgi:polyphosphate kinase